MVANIVIPPLAFFLLMLAWAAMSVVFILGLIKKANIRAFIKQENQRLIGFKWLDKMVGLAEAAETTDELLDVRTKLAEWRIYCVLDQAIHVDRLIDKIDDKLNKIMK